MMFFWRKKVFPALRNLRERDDIARFLLWRQKIKMNSVVEYDCRKRLAQQVYSLYNKDNQDE